MSTTQSDSPRMFRWELCFNCFSARIFGKHEPFFISSRSFQDQKLQHGSIQSVTVLTSNSASKHCSICNPTSGLNCHFLIRRRGSSAGTRTRAIRTAHPAALLQDVRYVNDTITFGTIFVSRNFRFFQITRLNFRELQGSSAFSRKPKQNP